MNRTPTLLIVAGTQWQGTLPIRQKQLWLRLVCSPILLEQTSFCAVGDVPLKFERFFPHENPGVLCGKSGTSRKKSGSNTISLSTNSLKVEICPIPTNLFNVGTHTPRCFPLNISWSIWQSYCRATGANTCTYSVLRAWLPENQLDPSAESHLSRWHQNSSSSVQSPVTSVWARVRVGALPIILIESRYLTSSLAFLVSSCKAESD